MTITCCSQSSKQPHHAPHIRGISEIASPCWSNESIQAIQHFPMLRLKLMRFLHFAQTDISHRLSQENSHDHHLSLTELKAAAAMRHISVRSQKQRRCVGVTIQFTRSSVSPSSGNDNKLIELPSLLNAHHHLDILPDQIPLLYSVCTTLKSKQADYDDASCQG